MKIIFTIILLFFSFTNLTFSNSENTDLEEYFIVSDSSVNIGNHNKIEAKFEKGVSLTEAPGYIFSDNDGVQYFINQNQVYNSESGFKREVGFSNYVNLKYFIDTKDYIIIYTSGQSTYYREDGNERVIIYNKKLKNFLTINLEILLRKQDDTLIRYGDEKNINQKIDSFTIRNGVFIFAKPYKIGRNKQGFIKYEIKLDDIPDEYFNNFFNYFVTIDVGDTPFENEYLKLVSVGAEQYDYGKLLELGPELLSLSFLKSDKEFSTLEYLSDVDFKGNNPDFPNSKFLTITKVTDVGISAQSDFFFTLKNNGYAMLKNNYVLFNRDNSDIGFIYYDGEKYITRYFGSSFELMMYDFSALKFTYLPKDKKYIFSFIKTRGGVKQGNTVVVDEKNLYNLQGAKLYENMYYVGSKGKKHYFLHNTFLNTEGNYGDPRAYNSYYGLIPYNGDTYLYKSVDGYVRVSDSLIFEGLYTVNLGHWTDGITGENNDNAGNVNNSGGYGDNPGTLEENTKKAEEGIFKKYVDDNLEKNFPAFKNLLDLFVIKFPENYNEQVKIPYIKPVIENNKLKIDYGTQTSNLKPIGDNLGISNVGEQSEISKKLVSFIFVFIYLSSRFAIVYFSIIFIVYIYNGINKIINMIFGNSINNTTNSNIIGFSTYLIFLVSFSSIILTLIGYTKILTPLFVSIVSYLNLFVGFIVQNFGDFELFILVINFIGISISSTILLYLVYVLASRFGKLN